MYFKSQAYWAGDCNKRYFENKLVNIYTTLFWNEFIICLTLSFTLLIMKIPFKASIKKVLFDDVVILSYEWIQSNS